MIEYNQKEGREPGERGRQSHRRAGRVLPQKNQKVWKKVLTTGQRCAIIRPSKERRKQNDTWLLGSPRSRVAGHAGVPAMGRGERGALNSRSPARRAEKNWKNFKIVLDKLKSLCYNEYTNEGYRAKPQSPKRWRVWPTRACETWLIKSSTARRSPAVRNINVVATCGELLEPPGWQDGSKAQRVTTEGTTPRGQIRSPWRVFFYLSKSYINGTICNHFVTFLSSRPPTPPPQYRCWKWFWKSAFVKFQEKKKNYFHKTIDKCANLCYNTDTGWGKPYSGSRGGGRTWVKGI